MRSAGHRADAERFQLAAEDLNRIVLSSECRVGRTRHSAPGTKSAEPGLKMAVPVDVIPRRPTLLFIVVLSLLFVLMSLSSRTRYVGETRTMFERTVMTIFS